VLGVNDSPDVPVSTDPALHVEVLELYHSTACGFGPEYVTVAVNAFGVCPTSYAKGPTGVTLTVGSALTMTVATLEGVVTGVPELSVTCSSKLQVPVVDRMPVDLLGVAPATQENDPARSL
jgi:hypothetical protein